MPGRAGITEGLPGYEPLRHAVRRRLTGTGQVPQQKTVHQNGASRESTRRASAGPRLGSAQWWRALIESTRVARPSATGSRSADRRRTRTDRREPSARSPAVRHPGQAASTATTRTPGALAAAEQRRFPRAAADVQHPVAGADLRPFDSHPVPGAAVMPDRTADGGGAAERFPPRPSALIGPMIAVARQDRSDIPAPVSLPP